MKGGEFIINNVIIIGRIVRNPELRETDSKTKVTNLVIAVPRSFKSQNGEYEADFIESTLWAGIAETAVTYLKKGDLVALKGRLQNKNIELENNLKITAIQFIVEKLTFLAKANEQTEKEISS